MESYYHYTFFRLHSDGPITRESGEGPAFELQGTV